MADEAAPAPVETCDGELVAAQDARRACRRYFVMGFALLPWFWACNIWLFLPDFLHGRDPVIQRYTRLSAFWLAAYTAVLLPWTLTYLIGGPAVLGQPLYDALDIQNLKLDLYS